MTKHSEFPWHHFANSWQYTTIYAKDGTPICRLDLEDWGVTEENQQELEDGQAIVAALIAAAPETAQQLSEALDALEAARKLIHEHHCPEFWRGTKLSDHCDECEAARAVLAKAGRTAG